MSLATLNDRVQGLMSRRMKDQVSEMALAISPLESRLLHNSFKEGQVYNDGFE